MLFNKQSEDTKNTIAKELGEFIAFLQSNGLRPYLAYGTLLGAVRDNDFIGHDTDIDIAYLGYATNKKEALNEIEKVNNFFREKELIKLIKPKWCHSGKALGQSFVEMETMYVDLYHTWMNKDYYCPHHVLKDIQIEPFKETEIRGVKLPIPQDSEKLLETLYGDWQTPSKDKVTKLHPFKWTLIDAV